MLEAGQLGVESVPSPGTVRQKTYLSLGVVLLCAMSLGACSLSPDHLEETSVAKFDSCSKPELTRLLDAIYRLRRILATGAFTQCLQDAFIIEQKGVNVEEIAAQIFSDAVTITCVKKGACLEGGRAGGCVEEVPLQPKAIVHEKMKIESDNINEGSIAELSSIIAHESAHTHGFMHAQSHIMHTQPYPWSVPVQVATCMNNLEPDGWTRSRSKGDAILASIGPKEGEPFLTRCPIGSHLIGMEVAASDTVDRLRFACSDGSKTPTLSSEGDSDAWRELSCASGELATGAWSFSEEALIDLGPRCTDSRKLAIADSDSKYNPIDAPGLEEAILRDCPEGMALVGAISHMSDHIADLRWICEDIINPKRLQPVAPGPLIGLAQGKASLELCSSHGALHALYGQASEDLGVEMLGGECLATEVLEDGLSPQFVDASSSGRFGLDVNGGHGMGLFESEVFSLHCPIDMAIVGVQSRVGKRGITSLSTICAPLSEWTSNANSKEQGLEVGRFEGETVQALCNPGDFVVGLKSYARPLDDSIQKADTSSVEESDSGLAIVGVQPYCRRLEL